MNRLRIVRRWLGMGAGALLASAWMVTGACGGEQPWSDAAAAEGLRQSVEALIGAGARTPGSPANLAIEERVAERFAASGFEHGAMAYMAPALVPGATRLALEDGRGLTLYPLHPGLFRPGNFTERSFDARIVDLRDGRAECLQALRGVDLRGTLGLMDFHSGRSWEKFQRFGMRGFVFVGAETYGRLDAYDKIPTSEAAVPRFLIDARDGAALRATLGTNRTLRVRVEAAPSRWELRELRTPWVLAPGADPVLRNEVVVLTAPLDANCVAPDLAEGAGAAANLYLLLQVLDDLKRTPPARTVLLAAVNARTQNYLGDRVLAWHLMAPQDDIEELRTHLAADVRLQERMLHFLERLQFRPETRAEDEAFLIALRTLTDDAIGRQISVKSPLVALCRREVNDIKTRRLQLYREERFLRERRTRAEAVRTDAGGETVARFPPGTEDEASRSVSDLEAERARLELELARKVNVLTLFNRVGVRTALSDLSDEEEAILRGYVTTVVDRNREWARLNREDLKRSERNGAIRGALGGRRPALVLSLEQTWTGERSAFSSGLELDAVPWADRFGRHAMRLADNLDAVAAHRHPSLLLDALTQVGGLHERHYVPAASMSLQFYHRADRTPALSLNTAYSHGGSAFTPADTFARLPWGHVDASARFLRSFLPVLLADPTILSGPVLPAPPVGTERLWSVRVKTFAFDEFSAAVEPEIPVPGSVVILTPPNAPSHGFTGDGVMSAYMALTDARAVAVFHGLREPLLSSSAFRFDDDFVHVRYAVDAGETHRKIDSNMEVSSSRTLSLIPCEEFVVRDRVDAPHLGASPIATRVYYPLSATRDAAPRRYGISGVTCGFSDKSMPANAWGPAVFYPRNGERLKLATLTRRLALNADEETPEGIGFASDEDLGPDFFRQALTDMNFLNRQRHAGMGAMPDMLTSELLERGRLSAEAMAAAGRDADHLGYLRGLYDALGAQVKAYARIAATIDDMLKAVALYMVLLLPFCFFVQKLLFHAKRLEAQLGLFVLLFVLCYVAFRFLHPAFRVARAPEAMFIAFVMCGLGVFVIWILHGRFEGEMRLLFNAFDGAAPDTGYGMVGQQALLMGVDNMKRRRIRTTLTTVTIVLVTFTMLAFTSVTRRMSPTVVAQARVAPYTGLMVHWPGAQCMDEDSHEVLRHMFAGQADVLTRRWLLPASRGGVSDVFRVTTDDGRAAEIEGVLGVDTMENGFLGPWPTLAGGFFSADAADEVMVASSLANALGIGADQVGRIDLQFRERRLKLVGIVDDGRLRSRRDLNGLSILPVKRQARPAGDDESAAVTDAGTLADESGVFYVETTSLLILPLETARRMGAGPYSVSIRCDADTPLWPFADRLLMATRARFFIGSLAPFTLGGGEARRRNAPGVYYVGAGTRTSIGGLATLPIPLLIAGAIVFNTMLGSVFERKREIAVLNAVGLNPTHIGLFFLAESFVYGILGSVGGYMIGQATGMALNRLGWIEGIQLDFSSLSVAYVILFAMAVVLLSTIYPAIVATRAVVPSGRRKWAMPPHDGHRMTLVFPFVYQPDLVTGAMGYIDAFFSRHTEASTGDLIAARSLCEVVSDAEGRPVYRLAYRLALAPFDLGVTQTSLLEAAHDPRVEAYRMTLRTTRESGQDANWVTTNKPYLEGLRRLLLHWRNLNDAEHGVHIRHGDALFARKERHGRET